MVTQMVMIGEESGAIDDMLSKVAAIFEQEVDDMVDGLTSLLEPIIMVVLGVLVGFGAHFVLLELIGKLLPADLPPVSPLPALQGIATGMLLLVGFALPPVLQLRNVPHNRVIRREQAAPQPVALATYGLGAGVFVALLLWQAGDPKLALTTAGGFLAGFAVFALVAWLGLRLLRRLALLGRRGSRR